MKTSIPFYHKVTKVRSNCGDPLQIETSSKDLGWKGLLLERGTSPYFYPQDVTTPNFYFAIEMENTYSWSALKSGNEVVLQTEPGDLWINPPNTPFTHNIDVPCNFLIVNISPERMYESFHGTIPEGITFLNNYNIQDKTLEYLLYLLLFEVQNGGQNGAWFVDHTLQLFANYFIQHFSNYDDLIQNLNLSSIIGPEEMRTIDIFIARNIALSITIDDLARELNISKFHFLNEFKKYSGMTPYQHILNTRIEKAKLLLSQTDKKITEIAHDLGFSDSSHFSRTFKKASGQSPKAFRG